MNGFSVVSGLPNDKLSQAKVAAAGQRRYSDPKAVHRCLGPQKMTTSPEVGRGADNGCYVKATYTLITFFLTFPENLKTAPDLLLHIIR